MKKKIELERCSCGDARINIEKDNKYGIHGCLIGCMNICCDNVVMKFALSEDRAYKKAAKAWNRMVKKG